MESKAKIAESYILANFNYSDTLSKHQQSIKKENTKLPEYLC